MTRSLLSLAILLSPALASADAIQLRGVCPEGWQPRRFGHSSRCFPVPCATDADCNAGSCQEVSRCWVTRSLPAGRGRHREGDPRPTGEVAEELCEGGAACGERGECRRERECVDGPPTQASAIPTITPASPPPAAPSDPPSADPPTAPAPDETTAPQADSEARQEGGCAAVAARRDSSFIPLTLLVAGLLIAALLARRRT